jgi:hypothetical protein
LWTPNNPRTGEQQSPGLRRESRSYVHQIEIGGLVPSEAEIEKAAAAAAEKANGGKFADPLFYKPEHRAFWQSVIRTAFDAAEGKSQAKRLAGQRASKQEVTDFANHCVYIRSVYLFMLRIWRDSSEDERKSMKGVAQLFFQDMTQVLSEYMIIAACRVPIQPEIEAKRILRSRCSLIASRLIQALLTN